MPHAKRMLSICSFKTVAGYKCTSGLIDVFTVGFHLPRIVAMRSFAVRRSYNVEQQDDL